MADKSDLAELMTYVGERIHFTADHYPVLEMLSSGQETVFAVNHSVQHMCKSLGRIATECEQADHGGDMDQEALKAATTKMLINTLKPAEVIGMSASDLVNNVPVCMKSK